MLSVQVLKQNAMGDPVVALKTERRDPGLLSNVPHTSSFTATMRYGDVANVPFFNCEPIKVRIVTDRGEAVYDLE